MSNNSTQPKHEFSEMLLQDRIRFGFSVGLLLLFSYTAYESVSFMPLSRYLPFTASLVAIVMMLFSIFVDIGTFRREGRVAIADVFATSSMAVAIKQEDAKEESEQGRGDGVDESFRGPKTERDAIFGSFYVFSWIIGYIVGIAVVGLTLATLLYLGFYLGREAKASWKLNLIGNTAVLVGLNVLREALNLQWPPYLLKGPIDTAMAPLYRIGEMVVVLFGG
jgi:hypothetical protein